MSEKPEIENEQATSSGLDDRPCYAMLQPSDSKRVADAIIQSLDGADFDVALECGRVIREQLSRGFSVGLGHAIACSVERAVAENLRA